MEQRVRLKTGFIVKFFPLTQLALSSQDADISPSLKPFFSISSLKRIIRGRKKYNTVLKEKKQVMRMQLLE